MFDLEIKLTEDNSHTLFVRELNETYHSVKGAIQEAQHVYIQKGLADYVKLTQLSSLNVLEIGFGTGLNTHLAHEFAAKNKIEINYTSIETFPIELEIIKQLNYPELIAFNHENYFKLHTIEWNKPTEIDGFFKLQKVSSKLENTELPATTFDVIFFDAFAPDKQPEIWSKAIFENLMTAMKQGAFLVTYCAKGEVKRNLKSIGFRLETLQGPPGKREMIRAVNL